MISISKRTARRFVLGRQGLWPGRRWRGTADLHRALLAVEAVQEDPLNVVARSHDTVLASRVLGYRPEHLDELLYRDRLAFEYGGALFVYPMAELPYWRLHMERRKYDGRFPDFAAANPELMAQVRAVLAALGPIGNRDMESAERIVGNYRGRKPQSLALYHLWLTGETLLHHRTNFQRYYDLRERIAPPEHDWAAPENDAEAFFARKEIALYGLIKEREWRAVWSGDIHRKVSQEEGGTQAAALKAVGMAEEVRIEGSKDAWLMLAEDVPLLQTVADEQVPAAWRPLETTTDEEAVVLAPLDIVSARGRAKWLFDFDYVWEVYKPVEQRRWGYYTMPLLYGDGLVARLDPRYERGTKTLRVLGFWLEEGAPADAAFADALARGLARFASLHGAERVDLTGMAPPALAEHVGQAAARHLEGINADQS